MPVFLLLSVVLSWSATLAPTKTHAVLNVTATNPQGEVQPGKLIQFKSDKTGKVLEATTDSRGTFSILIPKAENFKILYQALSGPIECGEVTVPPNAGVGSWSVEFDDRVFELKEVYFETGKATIKSSSYKQLDLVAKALILHDTLSFEIAGHTDDVGGEEYNQKLSQDRADGVKEYLVRKGVPASRLTAVGYAYSRPVADNSSESGRAKNRRIEIITLEKAK